MFRFVVAFIVVAQITACRAKPPTTGPGGEQAIEGDRQYTSGSRRASADRPRPPDVERQTPFGEDALALDQLRVRKQTAEQQNQARDKSQHARAADACALLRQMHPCPWLGINWTASDADKALVLRSQTMTSAQLSQLQRRWHCYRSYTPDGDDSCMDHFRGAQINVTVLPAGGTQVVVQFTDDATAVQRRPQIKSILSP